MKKYDDYSDEELIALLTEKESGEAGAIMDHLMEKYKPLVRKKTNALYLIGGDSDDLIQEGMIGLFKAVRDFDHTKEASFFHFAEICITRQLYSALAASNRKKHIPLNTYISFYAGEEEEGVSLEEMLVGQETDNPEQLIIEKELWAEFWELLWDSLSKMEQEVLSMYLEGKAYTEIADLMNKSPKSIDNALQRIRQKIGALKVGE